MNENGTPKTLLLTEIPPDHFAAIEREAGRIAASQGRSRPSVNAYLRLMIAKTARLIEARERRAAEKAAAAQTQEPA